MMKHLLIRLTALLGFAIAAFGGNDPLGIDHTTKRLNELTIKLPNGSTITAETGSTLDLTDSAFKTPGNGSTFAISGTGAPLIFHVSGSTDLNLPTTGTLGTLAGAEQLTNKQIALGNNTVTLTVPSGATRALSDVVLEQHKTPQDYGAIADGTSHPVSEWLTGGLHDRGYANLAAIQVDYPHVVSLTDESDWAAAQQALRLNSSVFLPSGVTGYFFNRELGTTNTNQIIEGYGSRVIVGSGVDGFKLNAGRGTVRDLAIEGTTVAIHKVQNVSGSAVVDTQTAHGLATAPEITNGWTIASNTVATPTIVTTSAAHNLRHGDIIKVTGNAAIPSGFYFAIVTDNAGTVAAPNPTSQWLRLVKASDHTELGAASNGGAASFVKAYSVAFGPAYGFYGAGIYPLTNSDPKIIGNYLVIPTTTTRAELYDEAFNRLVMTTPSDDDKGILYTSRNLVSFTNGTEVDNSMGPPDPGRMALASNLIVKNAYCGVFGSNSDGGSKIDHVSASTVGVGFWASGNIDTMLMDACWVDGTFSAGYMCSGNGGIKVTGGGGGGCMRPVLVKDQGNRVTLDNLLFEGHQGETLPDGNPHYYVECGVDNSVQINRLYCFDTGEPAHAQLHAYNGVLDVRNSGAFNQFVCWSQGTRTYGDLASRMQVQYYGSGPLAGYFVYQAGDYDIMGTGETLPSVTSNDLGRKMLVINDPGFTTTAAGLYQVLNTNGTPAWTQIGFDTLGATRGGTGLTTYTTGDLLYASATNTLSKLNAGADGKVLTLASGVPSWQDAPGGATTYGGHAASYLNMDTIHTTLTNFVTINPSGGVPVGQYKVIIDGGYGVGGGGAGLKWDLGGGTAVMSKVGDYRRMLTWNHSGQLYEMNEFSTDDGTNGANADIIAGEVWGTGNPAVIGAGRQGFHYEGIIDVTTAGSIIFRVACADATNGTTITDEGQMFKGTSVTLIKQ